MTPPSRAPASPGTRPPPCTATRQLRGGAIYNEDNLSIANSGFLANSTGGYGGAICTEDYLHARHITVTANAAGSDNGGIYNDDDTATVSGYIVFGNQPDNCYDVPGC